MHLHYTSLEGFFDYAQDRLWGTRLRWGAYFCRGWNHDYLGDSLVYENAGSTLIRLLELRKEDRALGRRPKGLVHTVFYSADPDREEVRDCLQPLRSSAEGRRQSSEPVGDLGKDGKVSRWANGGRTGVDAVGEARRKTRSRSPFDSSAERTRSGQALGSAYPIIALRIWGPELASLGMTSC